MDENNFECIMASYHLTNMKFKMIHKYDNHE